MIGTLWFVIQCCWCIEHGWNRETPQKIPKQHKISLFTLIQLARAYTAMLHSELPGRQFLGLGIWAGRAPAQRMRFQAVYARAEWEGSRGRKVEKRDRNGRRFVAGIRALCPPTNAICRQIFVCSSFQLTNDIILVMNEQNPVGSTASFRFLFGCFRFCSFLSPSHTVFPSLLSPPFLCASCFSFICICSWCGPVDFAGKLTARQTKRAIIPQHYCERNSNKGVKFAFYLNKKWTKLRRHSNCKALWATIDNATIMRGASNDWNADDASADSRRIRDNEPRIIWYRVKCNAFCTRLYRCTHTRTLLDYSAVAKLFNHTYSAHFPETNVAR